MFVLDACRAAWLRPFVYREMVRTGRSGRLHLVRIVYALFILSVLGLGFLEFQEGLHKRPYLATRWWYQAEHLADVIEHSFFRILYVQLAVIVLLTPVYLGGAIAEEREDGKLEMLVLAGLGSWQIVLGKLCAGLWRLAMIPLTGLPIAGLLKLLGPALDHFGDILFDLLLAGAALTAVTLLSAGALTLFCSACCRRTRDAVLLTYLLMLVFLSLTYLAQRIVPPPTLRTAALLAQRRADFPAPVEFVCRGNPGLTLMHFRQLWDRGTDLQDQLAGTVLPYLLVHGLAALIYILGAILQLRASGHEPAGQARETVSLACPAGSCCSGPRANGVRWCRWRPTPGRWPLLWKEIFVDQDRAFWRISLAVTLVLVLLSLAPVARIAWQSSLHHAPRGAAWLLADLWCRVVITVFAGLMLVRVALHAAGSFSGERERRTLDNLLATPVELRTILFSKWLGSLLSTRGCWLWLFALWGVSMVCGGTHGCILLAFLGAWTVYAGCFAMLGLWFSVKCANTQKATLWTLTTLLILNAGHWLPWLVLDKSKYTQAGGHHFSPDSFLATQMFGLTPPAALGWIALRGVAVLLPEGAEYRGDIGIIRWEDVLESTRKQPPLLRSSGFVVNHERLNAALLGIGVGGSLWLALAWRLWSCTLRRLHLLRICSGISRSGPPRQLPPLRPRIAEDCSCNGPQQFRTVERVS